MCLDIYIAEVKNEVIFNHFLNALMKICTSNQKYEVKFDKHCKFHVDIQNNFS